MCGPSGIGFLWGRAELLLEMEPFLLGGHMIRKRRRRQRRPGASCRRSSRRARRRWPRRSGSAPRSTTSRRSGSRRSRQHEHALAGYALERLGEIPGRDALRPAARAPRRHRQLQRRRASTRTTSRRSSTSTAIAIRAGHHCCQPLMRKLGVAATNRASFYLYTVPEEIDRLAASRPQGEGADVMSIGDD